MRAALRRAAAALLPVAVLSGAAWLSTAPMQIDHTGNAVMRISMGARPERIEVCRTQTDEELAKLAPQMRQTVLCDGTTARYQLSAYRNGIIVFSSVIRGGGLRNDRPLYVSRHIEVAPGPADYTIQLKRLDSPADKRANKAESHDEAEEDSNESSDLPTRAAREVEERRRRNEEAIPASLRLDLKADLGPREVLLITYDPEERRLLAVRSTSDGRK